MHLQGACRDVERAQQEGHPEGGVLAAQAQSVFKC